MPKILKRNNRSNKVKRSKKDNRSKKIINDKKYKNLSIRKNKIKHKLSKHIQRGGVVDLTKKTDVEKIFINYIKRYNLQEFTNSIYKMQDFYWIVAQLLYSNEKIIYNRNKKKNSPDAEYYSQQPNIELGLSKSIELTKYIELELSKVIECRNIFFDNYGEFDSNDKAICFIQLLKR